MARSYDIADWLAKLKPGHVIGAMDAEELTTAADLLRQQRAMLEQLEWRGAYAPDTCPLCIEPRPAHEPGCTLADLLNYQRAAPTTVRQEGPHVARSTVEWGDRADLAADAPTPAPPERLRELLDDLVACWMYEVRRHRERRAAPIRAAIEALFHERAERGAAAIHEHMCELLRILNLGDHARPESPAAVMELEIIPAVRRLAPRAREERDGR